MRNFFFISAFFAFVFAVFAINSKVSSQSSTLISPVPPALFEKTVSKKLPGVPVKISIPKLNVNAVIEPVAKDKDGLMDIPKDVYNAAWYSPGAKPGNPGNAVIAGHLNTPKFTPSIFTKLDTLVPGDEILIYDKEGNVWNFTVLNIQVFSSESFPINLVFGPSDKKYLNLITCSGIWQKDKQNYSQRTVVFSKLISS